MERLSKPERIGLLSFAIIIAAFLAINLFIKDGGYTAKPLTPEETAKMGNWRNISNLPETAWSWLEAYMPKEGPIFPYSYATYRRIRKLLSVKIPKDGLRHSMASYGYHELGIETTVEILGQESGYEVFKRHYKAMVTPDDAKAFFSISPDIRDGLPKTKSKQMPYRGLVGEIEENIKFLDKAKKQ